MLRAIIVNKVGADEYGQFVNYARDFLSGNYGDLINRLSNQMYKYGRFRF